MFITAKTAAIVATAVLSAHAIIGMASVAALQAKADQAVMPIVVAERIDVVAPRIVKMDRIIVQAKAPQIVKAERIEIVATTPAASQLALTAWNAVA